jgi:hypothetical protein
MSAWLATNRRTHTPEGSRYLFYPTLKPLPLCPLHRHEIFIVLKLFLSLPPFPEFNSGFKILFHTLHENLESDGGLPTKARPDCVSLSKLMRQEIARNLATNSRDVVSKFSRPEKISDKLQSTLRTRSERHTLHALRQKD